MSLIAELKRRNVFRVGVAYGIVAWLLIEVASVIMPALHLPDWALTLLVILVVAGFPLALIVAWAFELTPEGIKREAEVDRAESIRHQTGPKLDFIIIGVLAVGIVYPIKLKTCRRVDSRIPSLSFQRIRSKGLYPILKQLDPLIARHKMGSTKRRRRPAG